MNRQVSLTDRLRVESPCPVAWESMRGGDRERFCAKCGLHVHNLSAMTRAQADALLGMGRERLCVNYLTRADGRPLTLDDQAELGWWRWSVRWPRLGRLVHGVAAGLGLGLIAGALQGCWPQRTLGHLCAPRDVPPANAPDQHGAEPTAPRPTGDSPDAPP